MLEFSIDTDKKCNETLGDLFGIFFEDLNHAADGGLYAELVQNRSFEFDKIDNANYGHCYAWESKGAELRICTEHPYTRKNPHYLAAFAKKGEGFVNKGFNSGMFFEKGESYSFTCTARAAKEVSLSVRLIDANNELYASQELKIAPGEWKKYECELENKEGSCIDGRLAIVFNEPAQIEFDFISLFPKHTFKNRKNGMRRDIAELLAAMKPKFMRFPGGCLVHDGQLDMNARDSMYRWKNTIGPVEERPARRNNWGYNQTLGLGFFEYFQFAEDIGAEPLPVLPAAYDPHHQRKVPIDELGEWIADALDLIEFANGDTSTHWGGIRESLGHSKPFNLKYIAIGNEEVGEGFTERYPHFHRAIKEKYPEINIIGSASPFAAGGEFERGWRCARENKSDLIDEHYYMNKEWFIANMDRYDSYSANDPKVFLGEYASWGNKWSNALTEAAFMTCLENASHAVKLACYAPLLANVDYVNWRPDMIWFDNYRAYGTANYYVQKLFMNHQGSKLLSCKSNAVYLEELRLAEESARAKERPIGGSVGLQGNENDSDFKNITVTNNETGESVKLDDIEYRADDNDCGRQIVEAGRVPDGWNSFTVALNARELTGRKGFNIRLGEENDCFLFTFGGWQNLDISIEHFIDGKGACLSEAMFAVERGHEYEISVKIENRRFTVAVDGTDYLFAEDRIAAVRPIYLNASEDEPSGDIIIKAVNLKDTAQTSRLKLSGLTGRHAAEVYTIFAEPESENSFEEPKKIAPVHTSEALDDGIITCEFPASSLTIIRISPLADAAASN